MESRTPTIAWNMPSGVAEKILKNHEKPNLLHAAGGTRQLEIPPSVPLISHMNPFPSMHHAKEKNRNRRAAFPGLWQGDGSSQLYMDYKRRDAGVAGVRKKGYQTFATLAIRPPG